MLFSETSDFLRYSAKSIWLFSPLICLFVNQNITSFASFSISMLWTANLFFAYKNNNCCYLCHFYHECASELIDWLIWLVHQLWLVHLNEHQLHEILLTALFIINYNVNTLKACSKIFHICKTKCYNKTASEIIAYSNADLKISLYDLLVHTKMMP